MSGRYLQREKLFVRIFLLCAALVLAHFIHMGWLSYLSAPAPRASANVAEPPIRVGMPALLHALEHLFHPRDRTLIVTATDGVSAFLALNILYSVMVWRTVPAGSLNRMLVVGFFLAFLQFPLQFVVPWQRPETMPTTLYLALALLCLQRGAKSWPWTAALLIATALQALLRADVAFVFGCALLVISFAGGLSKEFGTRSSNIVRALCIMAISGGYQGYMQFIVFRNVPYQKGSPISANFGSHVFPVFVMATLPFFLILFLATRQSRRWTAVEAMAVCVSVLYMPLFFILGIVGEVRIYVPFLFCLCIVAAKTSATYLLSADSCDGPASKESA